MNINAYKTLKLHRGSDDAAIKEAFREACGRLHPDRDTGNVEQFMEVTSAYHTIKNEKLRGQLASFMAFTMDACIPCGGLGYKKKAGKGGVKSTACGVCNGSGFTAKGKK